MIRRGLALVAAVLALCLLGAAGAAAQEQSELWEEFPLEPTPAPSAQAAPPSERPRTAAVQDADDGGASRTPWILAGVLGVAGIAMTIAGLAAARRAPVDPAPEATAGAAAPRRRSARAPAGGSAGAAARPARAAPVPARTPAKGAGPAAPGKARAGTAASTGPAAPGKARAGTAASTGPAAPATAGAGPDAGRSAAPRPAPVPVALTESSDWEECRVGLVEGEGEDHHFYAAPPGGGVPVARSPVFRARRLSAVMESASGRDALQVLVTYLLEAGWQLVGRDDDPWALHFRRRVRAPAREPARR
jgi:hypothetical protein